MFWILPKTTEFVWSRTQGPRVKYRVLNSFQWFLSHFFPFVSRVKFVLGRMASAVILGYGPNILIVHGTTKGGGGPRTTKKGIFFSNKKLQIEIPISAL